MMDLNTSGIYQIQSKCKPERIYIGSAIDFRMRWSNHISKLKLGCHKNLKLQGHFDKYGLDDFIFSIIEICFPEFLTAREQFYLNKLYPSFNICHNAGSRLGKKHSPESRKKISEGHLGQIPWNKGKKATEEAKCHQSESHRGQKSWNKGKHGIYSEETLKKIGDSGRGRPSPMKGKHHTKESLLKISIASRGRPSPLKGIKKGPISEEHRKRLRGNNFACGKRTMEQRLRMSMGHRNKELKKTA